MEANPPTCSYAKTTPESIEDFQIDCKLKKDTTDVLQFTLSDFKNGAESKPKVDFLITNFQNPYSTVLVQTNVRWFSDAACTKDQSQQEGTDLTFRAREMAENAATVSSTNNVIGFDGVDNAMVLKFTPGAPLAPSKTGLIDINIPDWYNIDNGAKRAYMYSETAIDKCTSDEITI